MSKFFAPYGFSLLEVMVAFALLALSFTALILVQGRATGLAIEARNISIATSLARAQLTECQLEAEKVITSVSDFKLEGDFSDIGFADFTFECHAPKFNMASPPTASLERGRGANGASAQGGSSEMDASFISMITSSLGDSVRELAVIVRWKDNNIEDEVRVVTHVIDANAMATMSRMLSQGVQSFGGATTPKGSRPPARQQRRPPPRRRP